MLSHEKFSDLLADKPEKTKTYKVDKNTMEKLRQDEEETNCRKMDDDEVKEVAEYLDCDYEDLVEGTPIAFYIPPVSCELCNRKISFLDVVKTAVTTGNHSKDGLKRIICGKTGYWVTITGTDDKRKINCANCANPIELACYNTEWYKCK